MRGGFFFMLLDILVNEGSVGLARRIILEEKARGAIVVLACHDGAMLEDLADEMFLMEEGILAPAG